jgi:hypothetical protein
LLGKTEKAAIKYRTCRCGYWKNRDAGYGVGDLKQIKRDQLYKETTQVNEFKLTKKQY